VLRGGRGGVERGLGGIDVNHGRFKRGHGGIEGGLGGVERSKS
jgi:hypothetical protein